MFQHNAELAKTGAIRDIFKAKFNKRLGLEPLETLLKEILLLL